MLSNAVNQLDALGTIKRRHFLENAFFLESILRVLMLSKSAVYMLVESLLIVSI